jgi:hypothetical protein
MPVVGNETKMNLVPTRNIETRFTIFRIEKDGRLTEFKPFEDEIIFESEEDAVQNLKASRKISANEEYIVLKVYKTRFY